MKSDLAKNNAIYRLNLNGIMIQTPQLNVYLLSNVKRITFPYRVINESIIDEYKITFNINNIYLNEKMKKRKIIKTKLNYNKTYHVFIPV